MHPRFSLWWIFFLPVLACSEIVSRVFGWDICSDVRTLTGGQGWGCPGAGGGGRPVKFNYTNEWLTYIQGYKYTARRWYLHCQTPQSWYKNS